MVAQAWSGPGLATADDCDVGEEVSRDEDVYGREWRDDDDDVRVGVLARVVPVPVPVCLLSTDKN